MDNELTVTTENEDKPGVFRGKQKVATSLMASFKEAQDIEFGAAVQVDYEIVLLNTLLNETMKNTRNWDSATKSWKERKLNQEEIKNLTNIIKQVVATKQVKHTLLKEIKMDSVTIQEFTISVLKILAKIIPDHLRRKCMNTILVDLIKPYREKQRIIGAEYEEIRDNIKEGAGLE